MRRKRRNKKRVVSDLNITNLVDVTFALLIIFMITAPMMTQGIRVDLPEAEAENVETARTIEITISDKNIVYINGKETSLYNFYERFNNLLAGNFETPVFISADKKVPYGIVIKVISDIQKAGAVKLGFITEPYINKD